MSTSPNAGDKTGKRLAIALLVAALVAGGGYVGWQLAQRQAGSESSVNTANETNLAEATVSDYLRSLKLHVLPGGKVEGNREVSISDDKTVAGVSGQWLAPVVFTTRGETPITYAVSAVNFDLKPNAEIEQGNPDFVEWDNALLLLMKKQGDRFVVVSAEPVGANGLASGKVSLLQTGAQSWGWSTEGGWSKQGYSIDRVSFYGILREKIASIAELQTNASDEGVADCTDPDSASETSCSRPTQLTADWKFIKEGDAYPLEVRWSGTVEGEKINDTRRIVPNASGRYVFPKEYNEIQF
ncbi:hypothetical protein OL229_03160 [Neisseriaceae bacterium JH1-16]|nr:hypothetical protein [Neisseriaceae bacterium JH1-16]